MNNTFYEYDSYRHVLAAEYEINDKLTFKSVSAAYGYDRSQATDTDGTAEMLFGADKDGHYDSFQQDSHLIGTAFDDRLDYTFGANYFKERNDSTDTNRIFTDIPFWSSYLSSERKSDNENESWGVFGQLTAHVTDSTRRRGNTVIASVPRP